MMAKTWTPKLKAEQYSRIKEGEWFEFVDFSEAREQYKKNIQMCRNAVEEYNQVDRPLRIFAIHGSGRSTNNTCAYELSNSKLFLQESLKATEEIDPSIEIEQISLRDYNIEACNNCFVDPNIQVKVLKGWKSIGKIKKHKGTFPVALNGLGKMSQILDNPQPVYSGDIFTITYKILDQEYKVEVTSDHRFFDIDGDPIEAKDIRIGQKLQWIGLECQECYQPFQLPNDGKYIPLFCSDKCRGKHVGEREGAKRRGKTYEEMYGEEKAKELKDAHSDRIKGDKNIMKDPKVVEEVAKKNRGKKRSEETRKRISEARKGKPLSEKQRKGLEPYWESMRGTPRIERIGEEGDRKAREYTSSRRGKTYEEIYDEETAAHMRATVSADKKGKTLVEMYGPERGEKIRRALAEGNAEWRKEHKSPWTEIEVANQLDILDISYQQNTLVGGKVEADFILDDLNLVIQVEGCYWHACSDCFSHIDDSEKYFQDSKGNPESRRRRHSQADHRDRYIQEKGYKVERIWEHELKENPQIVENMIRSISANHKNEYKIYECQVISVEKEYRENIQTYCLTMDEHPSFVIDGGLVSHNCVSTTSSLCGFPCDCFPFDPMQEIYPKLLRSDIIFCSTGVNQSTMSTRLKAMCDRMISLDGGFFREELEPKDGAFKDRMLALSASGNIAYDQRLYGRVGGYFISSKDELNKHPTVNLLHHFEAREREGLPHNPLYDTGFCELTAHVLRDGMEAYGFFHAPNYYACAPANPDEDYMYDKEYMMNDLEALDAGKQVVTDAITLAKELKENLPEFYPDRFNRT